MPKSAAYNYNHRAQLSKELDATKKRHLAEQEQIDGLSQTMQKIEASQVKLVQFGVMKQRRGKLSNS